MKGAMCHEVLPLKNFQRKLGKKLGREARNKLHREITGQSYNYYEVIERGYDCFRRS